MKIQKEWNPPLVSGTAVSRWQYNDCLSSLPYHSWASHASGGGGKREVERSNLNLGLLTRGEKGGLEKLESTRKMVKERSLSWL